MARGHRPGAWFDPGFESTPEPGPVRVGRWAPAAFVLVLALASVLLVPGAARAATCQQSGPADNSYTVNVCFTSPADGGTVTGPTSVSATVSVTGTSPGVRRMTFFLDGSYVLTDYQTPYTFTIPSAKFVDGVKTLEVEAWMRDTFISQRASIALTFANGITTPPVNTKTFTPTSGMPPSGSFVVAAAGDGAGGEQSETDTTNQIASWDPNLFLYLGDVYEKATVTEFYNWYGQAASTFYGRFRSITNPTIGNHEYENGQAPGYFDYWDNVPDYYSFNANGWHLISLNANSAFNQTAPGTPQYDWLVGDLSANTLPCVIAYWHQPLYNIGQEPPATNMTAIWSLLRQSGVDLVVNGHDHTYQRWVPLDGSGNPDPNGMTEIVVGTGGHAIGAFVQTDSRVAATATQYGALRLVLNSGGASYQFITTQGQTLDSGSVGCNGAASDTIPPSAPASLTATGSYKTRADLSWTASSDNVGVTGYQVYRDGQPLVTIGAQPSYADTSVLPGSTHSYQVRAVDAANNLSSFSNSATATTPTVAVLFHDGFESGDFSGWTQNSGLVVQQAQVFAGAYAAQAISTGSAGASAYKQLSQNETNLHSVTRFKVLSQSQNINLLRFRNSTVGASAIATLFVSSTNRVGLRNDVAAISTTSTTVAATGAWHTAEVHLVVNGTSSQTEVWIDGVLVPELSQNAVNLGTNPIGRLELGDSSLNRTFNVAFDEFAYDREFIGDLTAPTIPGGLSANGVYKTQIDLAWTASTDDVGVTGYEVWRDGSPMATISAQPTTYSDTAVAPGSTHSYRVRARDAAGNVSDLSNSASATTPTTGLLFHDGFETGDLSKWTSPSSLVVQQQDVFTGSWAARAAGASSPAFATRVLANRESDLYWQVHFKVLSQSTNASLLRFRTANASLLTAFVTATDKVGYRNEVTGVSTTSTAVAARGAWHTLQLHVVINGAASQTEVWLDGAKIAALSNNEDLGTSPIARLELGDNSIVHTYDLALDDVDYDRVFIADSSPPSTPSNLIATPHSGFEIDLSWTASSDDTGVSVYEIYRGGSLIGTAAGSATSYADTAVSPLTSYTYAVRARDAAGNLSGYSNNAFATTGDAFADDFESGTLSRWTGVAGLTLQQSVVDGGQWAARATSDGTGGSSAQVQLDQPVGELYYRARFRIAAQGGNSVSLIRFRTVQTAPLASAFVSSNGKLGYRNDTNSSFSTSTQSVSSGIWHELQMHLLAGGATSWVDVWLDGVKVISQADSLANGTIGQLELGDPASSRTFDVVYDNVVAGPIFIADAAAPTGPQNLRSTNATVSQVDLAWDPASDDVGVTAYRIYRNGAPTADIDGSTLAYSDTGLTPGTQYSYTATALDAVGHESAASNALVVTTTTKPNKPMGLTAAAVSGQNAVNLSWSQPVGGAPVTGYRIYRDSSPTPIGTVNGAGTTTYVDSTVAPVTAYAYTVTAVDSAGHESEASDSAMVTTSDTVKPSAPTGLAATAVTSTRIDLSWTAASDNVGVTGYRIYRNGSAIPLASVSGAVTTYSDSTVAPATVYTYTVTALDGAGNESPASSSATSTTGPRLLTFAPSDDTYVQSDKPASNFGSANTWYADNSPVKQGLLKFAVTGIGAGSVQSAKLRIYCVDPSGVGGSFYRLADPMASWSESAVTWANSPPAQSSPLAVLGRVVANTWYEVDVTPLVAGDGPASLRITSTSTDGAHYASKENSAALAPQLIVTVGASVPDTTPPSDPTNLHVVSSSASQVVLGWTASNDNIRVSNYRIWRNGTVLTTTGAGTSYTDTSVTPLTHYTYNVQALDPAGNASGLSNSATMDTPAPNPVLTFTPSDDATIRFDTASANLGSANSLEVDNSPVRNALLRFTINGIASRTVANAKLRLYCVDAGGSGGDFHRLTNPAAAWAEGTVTWNTAPAADPAIVASLGRVVVGTWYEVNVTSLVSGDGVLNLRASSTSSDAARYSSKEGSFAPQLVVTLAG